MFAGIDTELQDGLVVGLMGAVDYSEEDITSTNGWIDGTGWFLGPYIVNEFDSGLVFDGYVGLGRSTNHISPFGTYIDEFTTNRTVAQLQLTRAFALGQWMIEPQGSVTYLRETQQSYEDSNGIRIAGQTSDLGQFRFGPRFSTAYSLGDSRKLEPYGSFEGIWNFAGDQGLDPTTGAVLPSSENEWRARVDLGMRYSVATSTEIAFDAYLDGIGDSGFEAFGLSLSFDYQF